MAYISDAGYVGDNKNLNSGHHISALLLQCFVPLNVFRCALALVPLSVLKILWNAAALES